MVDIYKAKGFSEEDAEAIIGIFTSKEEYAEAFIDHMMVEELGYIVPKGRKLNGLWLAGVVTSMSFFIFGSLPLWTFAILESFPTLHFSFKVGASAAVTMLSLFTLGIIKGRLNRESEGVCLSGMLLLLNGALAAVIAFLVGGAVHELVGSRVTCVTSTALTGEV